MYNKEKIKRSLKTKVVFQVGIIIVTILVFSLSFILYLMISNLKEKANNDLQGKINYLANNLEYRLEYLQESTELLASNKLLINAFIDEKEKDKYLLLLIDNFKSGKHLNSLSLLDFDGRVIFNSSNKALSFNKSQELRLSLNLSQIVTYMDEIENEIVYIVPIKYYGTTQGAIVAKYDLKNIVEQYDKNQNFIFTKISTNTREYYRKNFENEKSYYKYMLSANTEYKILNNTGLIIEMGISKEIYNKPLFQQILIFTIASLFILLICLYISYIMAKNITNPILALFEKVKRNSPENMQLKYEPLGTHDELEVLSYAFFNKEKELNILNKNLQKKVQEATNELEIEKNRFALATEGAKDGLWDWNLITDELFFSERFEIMLGYEIGDLPKNVNAWLGLLHPDDKEQASQIVQEYLDRKKGTYESKFRLRTKDGSWRWILGRGKAQFDNDGTPLRFVGFNSDITEQKKRESDLIDAKEIAVNASKIKSEFLANMSHEIRTPLNGVIGLIKLVLDTDLSHVQKDYLTKSITASNALLNIINDILDYSKIEAHKIELEKITFTLDDILHQLSDLFSYKAKEKDIMLNFEILNDTHNLLIGDPFRIKQVLINLIGNALKFTAHGSINIEVDLKESTPKQQTLLFSVKDTGIGIAKEKQEKLFKEFSQVDASNNRKYGGSGLGLTISKKLVELMRGEVFVESQENKGSTFSFSVTLDYIQKDTNFLTQNIKNKTILVINNLEIKCDRFKKILESFELKVTFDKQIQTVLETIKTIHFDYILVDCITIENDLEKLISAIGDETKTQFIFNIPYSLKDELDVILKSKNLPHNKIVYEPFSASTLLEILVSNVDDLILSENKNEEFKIKGKVLLVEDNEINQIVASQNLENFGLNVDIAEDGFQAVQKAKEKQYDMIFMDLQMPKMDGFEATKLIREFDKKTPIIALSASVQDTDREHSAQIGMNEHLEKPINLEKLKNVIKKYLGVEIITQERDIKKVIETIEGIDLETLISRFHNENEAYKTLQFFKDDKVNIINELENLEIDSPEFHQLIHSLKGVSGNLSLTDIFKYSSQIYTTQNNEIKKQTLLKLLDSIRVVFNSIDEKIKPKLKVKQEYKEYSTLQVKETIQNILSEVEKSSIIANDKVEELLNQIAVVFDEAKKDEIENYFAKFDYPNLKIKLHELIKEI